MTTYTARAQRSGRWWAIDVPELPGVYSQARRLDQVAAMAREAVALFLDVPESAIGIRVVPIVPTELHPAVEEAGRLRAEADRASQAYQATMRKIVRDMIQRGLTVRDAAVLLGISHQRVSQLAREPLEG